MLFIVLVSFSFSVEANIFPENRNNQSDSYLTSLPTITPSIFYLENQNNQCNWMLRSLPGGEEKLIKTTEICPKNIMWNSKRNKIFVSYEKEVQIFSWPIMKMENNLALPSGTEELWINEKGEIRISRLLPIELPAEDKNIWSVPSLNSVLDISNKDLWIGWDSGELYFDEGELFLLMVQELKNSNWVTVAMLPGSCNSCGALCLEAVSGFRKIQEGTISLLDMYNYIPQVDAPSWATNLLLSNDEDREVAAHKAGFGHIAYTVEYFDPGIQIIPPIYFCNKSCQNPAIISSEEVYLSSLGEFFMIKEYNSNNFRVYNGAGNKVFEGNAVHALLGTF